MQGRAPTIVELPVMNVGQLNIINTRTSLKSVTEQPPIIASFKESSLNSRPTFNSIVEQPPILTKPDDLISQQASSIGDQPPILNNSKPF